MIYMSLTRDIRGDRPDARTCPRSVRLRLCLHPGRPPRTAPGTAPGRCRRTPLNTLDLVGIGIGTVLGSGIFLVPSSVLNQSGGALGIALIVWVSAGILSVLGALTYGELGAMKPEAGGIYVYIRDAFGPFLAFLYGWALFFVIGSGSVATPTVAFTAYLQEFVDLGPIGSKIVAVVVIAILAVINVRGTRTSASVQNVMTTIKVAAIVALSLALVATGSGLSQTSGRWWPEAGNMNLSLLTSVGIAMVSVLWAYEGWQVP